MFLDRLDEVKELLAGLGERWQGLLDRITALSPEEIGRLPPEIIEMLTGSRGRSSSKALEVEVAVFELGHREIILTGAVEVANPGLDSIKSGRRSKTPHQPVAVSRVVGVR